MSARWLRRAAASTVLGATLLGMSAGSAQADAFRKCGFKVMVAANGMSPVEVPDARFTAWGRNTNDDGNARRQANNWLNEVAIQCAKAAFAGDLAQVPRVCEFNPAVHQSGVAGRGISGFALTRARRALKRAVCDAPRPPTTIKEATDTITRQGFRAWIQKTDGTGSCPEAAIFGPPRALRLSCKGHGRDDDGAGRWFMFAP